MSNFLKIILAVTIVGGLSVIGFFYYEHQKTEASLLSKQAVVKPAVAVTTEGQIPNGTMPDATATMPATATATAPMPATNTQVQVAAPVAKK